MTKLTIPDVSGKIYLVTGVSTEIGAAGARPAPTKASRSRFTTTPAQKRPNKWRKLSRTAAAPGSSLIAI